MRLGHLARLAADGGRGMQPPGQLDRGNGSDSWARIGVARCCTFSTLIRTGSSAAATHRLTGSRVRWILRSTMACSSRFLGLWRSCSPRWSSTAGSALRRVVPASATVWARAPSRRTSSSGLAPTNGLRGRRRSSSSSPGSRPAGHPAPAPGRSPGRSARAPREPARPCPSPPRDAFHRAADRVLVVRRRGRARDARARGRARVQEGHGPGLQLADPPAGALQGLGRRSLAGVHGHRHGQPCLVALAGDRQLRQHHLGGLEARPLGRGTARRQRTRSHP